MKEAFILLCQITVLNKKFLKLRCFFDFSKQFEISVYGPVFNPATTIDQK